MSIAADALAACVARASAAVVLTEPDKQVFVFREEGFVPPVPSEQRNGRQCNNESCFHKQFSTARVKMSTMHYSDVIMDTMASQITSLTIVYSTVYWGADQRKYQSSASLAFVRGPVNSPHKWPVTRKMFPFDDVIGGSDAVPLFCYIRGPFH